MSLGQPTDPLVSNCVLNAGADARYLKDFRIQLGKATTKGEMRFKANMSPGKYQIMFHPFAIPMIRKVSLF
jgi:hypothetical protein